MHPQMLFVGAKTVSKRLALIAARPTCGYAEGDEVYTHPRGRLVPARRAAGVARGQGPTLASYHRGPLPSGDAGSPGSAPFAPGRPPNPDPPRHLRSDRPAAHAGGGRRVRGRPVA